MRLDQLLVHNKLCESRTEAQELIASGYVLVNGLVTTKQTRQVNGEESIEITGRRKFVSRGGNKLEGALLHVYGTSTTVEQNIRNKQALDIGSSTGGFTDCLLQYGVTHVTAIDVGTDQLHHSLRIDSRISLFENTDIRSFVPEKLFDCIVADLSFITLEKVIDTLIPFGAIDASYFLLIKPQFEVGKGNTKKGIVKDITLLHEICTKYELLTQEKGLVDVSIFPCSIAGGDGNQEYFLYGKKNK
jgi:23S rRNA (cytidine1920-2'-O)/16S rRNA (cytidine1409-2'-O)-methyltransferase